MIKFQNFPFEYLPECIVFDKVSTLNFLYTAKEYSGLKQEMEKNCLAFSKGKKPQGKEAIFMWSFFSFSRYIKKQFGKVETKKKEGT